MTARPILFSAPMIQALLDGRKTQTRRILKPQPSPECAGFQTVFAQAPYFEAMDAAGRPINAFPAGRDCVSSYPPVHFTKGDRLWVRETWAQHHPAGVQAGRFSMAGRAGIPGPPCVTYRVIYRADGDPLRVWHCNDYPYRSAAGPRDEIDGRHPDVCSEFPGWDSPMCMPRWASRITLTVTDVRVQRLQDISEADAMEEGVTLGRHGFCVIGVEHPNKDFPTLSRPNAREMYAALWDVINGNGAWLANPWVVALTFTVERRNIDAESSS